jgi:biopolymer transport protein ExbD
MAFNLGSKKGPISEINVTPLVDVMLVLLVIFMITAPLMLNGIKLDLPKTKEVNPINLSTSQVILSYTASGDFYLGTNKILKNELTQEVTTLFKQNKTDTLFLRADFSVQYGKVASLMSYLKRQGIVKIALVTEIEQKK